MSQSKKLHEKIYDMLRKAEGFTPDTADEFKEETELLGKILLAHQDFQKNPPHAGHDGFGDMFGKYYEETEQLNARAGQFFTPMHVVKMMVEIAGGELTPDMPIQYASDPTAGCGRMMLKYAEKYHREIGCYNFLFNNVDIDKRMYTCCTMNAILYGIPSVNIWGNSISLEYWEGFVVMKPLGLPTQWYYIDREAAQTFVPKFERVKKGLEKFMDIPEPKKKQQRYKPKKPTPAQTRFEP